ncbi:MAG: penicillin acylase family protein [Nocardioidaceae bacterium]|nr:penicillin acylase family protein [Nocardioidaceae bacterium]
MWTVRRSFPQTEGILELAGLDSTVRVLRDGYGIPQVYADSPHDLFFAQGFVQAQDRFFEMDYRRHLASGRLAELFGRNALESDMFVRTLGWRRVAEQELALLSTDARSYLKSFAEGVNAYLAETDGAEMSLEYAALRLSGLSYTPEDWTPADSLVWLKAMSWTLGSNIEDEIDRSLQSAQLTRQEVESLWPTYPFEVNKPIVNQGALVDGVFEQDATGPGTRFPARPPFRAGPPVPARPPFRVDAQPSLREAKAASSQLTRLLGTGDSLGSNAWAVSGARTASGAPMIANDPHLGASLPSPWYQMGLHCNEVSQDCPFDVAGFTFAGLPGVVIGHNADIAWGLSTLFADVQDLYLEKLVAEDRYLYDGRERELDTRVESFAVEGEAEPVEITVRESQHGPLISDVDEELEAVGGAAPVPKSAEPSEERSAESSVGGYAVALRWTALEPGRTAEALFGLNTASNWNDFREAVRDFDVPGQSLVYADTAGHIGYQAAGLIPIRRIGQGNWPVPGWDPAYEWDNDFVPYDALPSVLDPGDGYVIAANQTVIGDDYPYYLGSSTDYGYRATRIGDLLLEDDSLTVEDMAAIQLDNYSQLAKTATFRLRDISLPGNYYQQGQRTLGKWDFHMDADSPGAAYFAMVWASVLDLTFSDQLPEDTLPSGDSRWWTVMEQLLKEPRNPFWDDISTLDTRETRDDILHMAMVTARDELTRRLSRRASDWQWGKLHTLTLRNESEQVTDGASPGFLFDRGGYELGGGSSIVSATSYHVSEGFEATSVPSMRMVVSLDDLDSSIWVNLTGASGHAFHENYTDQTDLWLDGQSLPWVFTRADVEGAAESELTLEPG